MPLRHLLTAYHSTSNSTLSPAKPQASNTEQSANDTILGIKKELLIEIGIIAVAIAIIIFIIVTIYKRHKTRKDYNQSPQNFAHKPDLGVNELYYLKASKVEACLKPEKVVIEELDEKNGKSWRVQFRGQQKSAVFFHRRQFTTSYFQVEILAANGLIEVGFVPVNAFGMIKKEEEAIGNSGVGVNNSGYVQAEGENLYNYGWSLAYGDVIGIGLTKQSSKFSERRAWISKNGVLLNRPPSDELSRWLATVDISAEQKNQFNLDTHEKEDESDKEDEKQDEAKIRQKAQRQKMEGLLKKQRISLKTFNPYEYYPVVYCHGNSKQNKSTVINMNVGGQIFRMNDQQFRSGLLKDAGLFGDD